MYSAPAKPLITTLLPISLIAAFVTLLPLLAVTPSGDVIMNYAQIECYSRQLWEGIFYPRWCVNPNGGMGSPAPIFYFPLAFYITAITWPLHNLGFTVHHQYLFGVYLANVAAFITTVIWLRNVAGIRIAYFAAFIFLICSYRSELLTRASYAEYWCVSFFPLLFHYAREMLKVNWKTWPKLSLAIAVCMFFHAPVTIIGLMGVGLYLLMMSEVNLSKFFELIFSCLLAAMLGLFHYLPMKLLEFTLNDQMGGKSHWQRSWVNSFIDQPQVYKDHNWALIGLGIFMLAAILIFANFVWKRKFITDLSLKREAMCWLFISMIAGFMMFSFSWPLWWPVTVISGVSTPWRMPSLIMLAMIFIGTVMIRYVWQYRRTKNGDAVVATMFFIFSSLFYYGGVTPLSLPLHKQAMQDQFIIKYFNTAATDLKYGKDPRNFFREFLDRPNRNQAEWLLGKGKIHVDEWSAKNLRISGVSDGDNVLRLEHFYYPIWQATVNGLPIDLQAEVNTGRILVGIPRGDFVLSLKQHYWELMPKQFWLVWMTAGISATIIGIGLLSSRHPFMLYAHRFW